MCYIHSITEVTINIEDFFVIPVDRDRNSADMLRSIGHAAEHHRNLKQTSKLHIIQVNKYCTTVGMTLKRVV